MGRYVGNVGEGKSPPKAPRSKRASDVNAHARTWLEAVYTLALALTLFTSLLAHNGLLIPIGSTG